MSKCTRGCPLQTCESYAACLRGKSVRVTYCNSAAGLDFTKEKKFNAELDAYATAKANGIQPAGTSMSAIRDANERSDFAGKAFRADVHTAL